MSWKNLKIGKKLYIGFGLVLVLAVAIGYSGYNGLSTVGGIVEIADNANRMIKFNKDCRVQEKNFIMRGDKKYLEQNNETMSKIYAQIDETMTKLKDQEEKDAIQLVKKDMQGYETALNRWVALYNEGTKADEEMVTASQVAMKTCQDLRDSQKELLNKELAQKASNLKLSEIVEKADDANQLIKDILEARLHEKNFLISKDEQDVDKVREITDRMIDQATLTATTMTQKINLDHIDRIVAAIQSYRKAFDQYVDTYYEQVRLEDEMNAKAFTVEEGCDKLREVQKDKMDRAQTSAITMAVSFVIGALIIGVLVAFIITRGIVKPLDITVDLLKDVAQGEGDLTRRIEVDQKDEVGDLARWFNVFMDKLHDIIATVAGNTEQLASAANEISSASEELSTGVKEQTNQTAQVSTAIEEMTATIVESSKNISEANEKAKNAGERSQEGSNMSDEASRGMDEIVESSNVTAKNIEGLSEKAAAIGEIISVIDDIADQTNLLALNAAIEAARAGEQGRGFAVVADEVRKLAERTTSATKEVADNIKGIQADVTTAATQMTDSTEIVNKGKEATQKTNEALNEIYTAIESVQGMMNQIATASEEQSTAAEQISRNIENVDRITKETATGTEQAASAAEQLNRQAEELRNLVGGFKLRKDAQNEVKAGA